MRTLLRVWRGLARHGDDVSALADERRAAYALADRAHDDIRFAAAVIRDGMLTDAETTARTVAFIECLDAEVTT